MAIEYRLPYTAQEINERLRKTDDIEHKQDKLAFDSEPTEGSENLVKSGDIYTAIQNATPNLTYDEAPTEGSENLVKSGAIYNALQDVGGTDLVAGDLIEIKDGVIRSTLGKCISGELIETIDVIFSDEGIEVDSYGEPTMYDYYSDSLTKFPDSNKKLTIEFTSPSITKKTFDLDIVHSINDEEETYMGFYNCEYVYSEKSGNELVRIDENSNALCFSVWVYDDSCEMLITTFEDYTGATLTIGTKTIVDTREYALLPDNALRAGNLIEIKDGVVSSTLGKSYTEVEQVTFFDSGNLILEDSYMDEEDVEDGKVWAEYSYMTTYSSTFLDKPENEEEPIDIEVKYYPPESDDFVVLKGLLEYSYDSKEDVYEYRVYVNVKLGEDDLEIDNTDYPMFEINAETPYRKENEEEYEDIFGIYVGAYGYGAQDISGARFVIDGEKVTKTTVKLPKEALDFTVDDEPTKDSENLVTSGAVYKALQNIDTSELTGKIEELTGKMIGKNGGGNGSEIFNNYINNVASGEHSHAEGNFTKATGTSSHAEGTSTTASGANSHAEGQGTTASGNYSHAEGASTTASGEYSHAEGWGVKAKGNHSHAQGKYNIEDTEAKYAHIVGNGLSVSKRSNAHTLDWDGNAWFAGKVYVGGNGQDDTSAKRVATEDDLIGRPYDSCTGAEIFNDYINNIAAECAHAEGASTTASGANSHAEGAYTTASGADSHAEGASTTASGNYSHAEGNFTKATGTSSHAEGTSTTASGANSHAEGAYTTASGADSHAEGGGTIASGEYSHVQGKYNIEDTEHKYAHIVGNGKIATRSNAHTLDWDGNAWYAGYVEGNAFILPSSTEGSTKRFKITVDDSGTLSATEIVEA